MIRSISGEILPDAEDDCANGSEMRAEQKSGGCLDDEPLDMPEEAKARIRDLSSRAWVAKHFAQDFQGLDADRGTGARGHGVDEPRRCRREQLVIAASPEALVGDATARAQRSTNATTATCRSASVSFTCTLSEFGTAPPTRSIDTSSACGGPTR